MEERALARRGKKSKINRVVGRGLMRKSDCLNVSFIIMKTKEQFPKDIKITKVGLSMENKKIM